VGGVIPSWSPAKDVIEWWASKQVPIARLIVSPALNGQKGSAILPHISKRKLKKIPSS
jgi:hypothetical protein